MLFGRIVGFLLVIGGLYLLLAYHSDWAGLGRWTGSGGSWDVGGESVTDYLGRSLGQSFSALLTSGWTAAALIALGVLLVWACRRGPA